ncbi:MAG: recombinase family protein [Steroidobacteraceae bacterium]
MRVGLYARVSTERQTERGTVGSQLEALRAAATAERHEVIEEFVDDGYSGARLDRPALDRLRDAAEAGVLEGVLCLCVDRLARAYAYQVLILEELERFGVSVHFLEGPAPSDDPQATLLIQMQGVIAEYEKAKIAERYRRGKLYRARAGEIPFWKCSYGHRRVVDPDSGRSRIEIYEPEAEVVREIFYAYVERGLSVRKIAFWLLERGIQSPSGKPQWGTSTLDRLLRNEAYIGTVYYNRYERTQGDNRGRMTRQRERPREEWIMIPVPAIIDRDTFDRVSLISHENWRLGSRGAAPDAWLLRGLVQCGHCHRNCNCATGYTRKSGKVYRYYQCRNHDLLRAGSPERLCPERNIRANELDRYVFEQVRQALLDPRQLLAAERALLAGKPDEDELVAAQLKRLDPAIDAKDRERARLLDAYQAGLIELAELTRRTAALTARRGELLQEKETLTTRSAELSTQNRLRRRLANFSERIVASLDELDFAGRQRLLRLVVEHVRVNGWRVEIHLKIPLPDEDPPEHGPSDPDRPKPGPARTRPLSSDLRLRSVHAPSVGRPAARAADQNSTSARHQRAHLDHRTHHPDRTTPPHHHRRDRQRLPEQIHLRSRQTSPPAPRRRRPRPAERHRPCPLPHQRAGSRADRRESHADP